MTRGYKGLRDESGVAAMRVDPRVDGPFEGRRVDVLDMALR